MSEANNSPTSGLQPPASSLAPKLSPVEGFKSASRYLRGEIAEELVDGNDHFGKGSEQLLKTFGTYQQDNRDLRGATKTEAGKSAKSYYFMVRSRVPGGRLTAEQLLAELDLADEVGNATLRITSRQGLQHHGVMKGDLQRTIRRINEIQLSTLAACGDVNRNVMCCPAPSADPIRAQLRELTDRVVKQFEPRTRAYHEIWLRDPQSGDDQLVGGGPVEDHEPIYGPTYLPRKFKIGIGMCDDNCIDIYANDLGLLAVVEQGQIIGFNILTGGGMGVTPSAAKTFPAVAKRLAFCRPEQVIDVATAVVKVQRDFGNRSDRKTARLKYTINNLGLEGFKAKVEEYFGGPLAAPHPADVHGFDDHLGWREQGDGKFYYGLNIENGRIADTPDLQLKSALREICATHKPGIRLTPHQSMLLTGLTEIDRGGVEEILQRHHVKLSEEISSVRRWSMACVAWPTCGLSITEAERALPGIIDQVEVELAKLGLSREVFTLRMTGCPNGCARPYNCDIGLVGKAAGKYTVLVGGRLLGDRLNFIYRDMVPEAEVVQSLVPVLTYFKQERQGSESVGDFCHRVGKDALLAFAEQHAAAV